MLYLLLQKLVRAEKHVQTQRDLLYILRYIKHVG